MTNAEINEAVAQKLLVDYCNDSDCPIETCPCEEKLKDYAGSILAAWEIVEHFDKFVLARADAEWVCSNIWDAHKPPLGVADTAPMAICLAFLKLP